MSLVFLSVVICTRNRANELNYSLQFVTEQAKKFTDVEVIIIDNGSTDNTKEVVAKISKENKLRTRYFYEPVAGLCHARNKGRETARGKVLAYIDDDVRISRQWMANLRQHFIEKRSDCLGGKVTVQLGGEIPFKSIQNMLWFFGETDFGNETKEYTSTDRMQYPIGCNMAFTTNVFDTVGGFNTDLDFYFDETDFFRRVKQNDFRILYVPGVEVEHFIPVERLTKKEMRNKTFSVGKGAAAFWLLSNPNFVQWLKKVGLQSGKIFYHSFGYIIKPCFGKFFALWFNCGYVSQLLKEKRKHYFSSKYDDY